MTTHDPPAREVLRAQLLETIDGTPSDGGGEHGDPSKPGLLKRAETFFELASEASLLAATVIGPANPPFEAERALLSAMRRGVDLVGDFRAFAMQVRALLAPQAPCRCPDPGYQRGVHCRAAKGFAFASDDWCNCWCHRTNETLIDAASTREGVRFSVGGALLRGGLDQRATIDVQPAIRFALDVLSAAFDHQAVRFDLPEGTPVPVEHAPCGDVLKGDEGGEARWPVDHGDGPRTDVSRLLRTFAAGARVTAALDIVYADRGAEIASGTRGTVVRTRQSRDLTGLSAVHWDDHDGIYPTANSSIDPTVSL